jgi:hypothetical protein
MLHLERARLSCFGIYDADRRSATAFRKGDLEKKESAEKRSVAQEERDGDVLYRSGVERMELD